MSRTPNYITVKEVIVDFGPHDRQVLPSGASVRPVLDQYCPKHILEKYSHISVQYTLCYTSLGFIPINKDWIRET